MQTKLKYILVVLAFIGLGFAQASSAFASGDHQHHNHNSTSPFEKANLNIHCLLKGHSLDNPCPHILKHLGEKSLPYFIGSDCDSSPFQNNATFSGFDSNFLEPLIEINSIPSTKRASKIILEKRSFLFFESIKPPPRFL